MTARYLTGHIVYPDIPDAPVSTFEIWDENPDILVRGYVTGELVSEISVRGRRLVAIDFASSYARVDDGGDPAGFRERALGMFAVPASTLALLRRVGRSVDPPGLVYAGDFDGLTLRLVVDEATGLLAEASGAGQAAIRIAYERDEQVTAVPPLTALPARASIERYDVRPTAAATTFGLGAIPHVPGFALDHTLVFTSLGGETMAEIGYLDTYGGELVARHLDEAISTTTTHSPREVEGVWRARLREQGAYIELEGPSAAALYALAQALRPGLLPAAGNDQA